MTIKEIERLAAKDAVVKRYSFLLRTWSEAAWEDAVDKMHSEFIALSVGEQAKIRMRYMR